MPIKKAAFLGAPAKLTIVSVENPKIEVAAQYNPKELQISQQIGWHAHQTPGATKTDAMLIEFDGMQPQTMSVELLFDGFENNGSFRLQDKTTTTVAEMIARLRTLASPRDPSSTDERMNRPYNCLVTWGVGGFPALLCVIESLAIKYTMLDADGVALRAVCTVGFKEANLDKTDLRKQAEKEQADHHRAHARGRAA
jgi:hypothetical protein